MAKTACERSGQAHRQDIETAWAAARITENVERGCGGRARIAQCNIQNPQWVGRTSAGFREEAA